MRFWQNQRNTDSNATILNDVLFATPYNKRKNRSRNSVAQSLRLSRSYPGQVTLNVTLIHLCFGLNGSVRSTLAFGFRAATASRTVQLRLIQRTRNAHNKGPKGIEMKARQPILLAALLPALVLAACGNARAEKAAEVPAINLWVDLGLGLINEEEAKEKMKSLDADFKTVLKSETNVLTSDLHGVRQVSGKQFASLMAKIDQVSSFSTTSVIGKTKKRAYLEVMIFLTSKHSYVAIVSAPLEDLPAAIREKL